MNLGGGFKVGRMPGEKSADMADVGNHVKQELLGFRERDGRSLHLEIEPGTFLVANGGWWWRPASTWSTPDATAISSPSSTPA